MKYEASQPRLAGSYSQAGLTGKSHIVVSEPRLMGWPHRLVGGVAAGKVGLTLSSDACSMRRLASQSDFTAWLHLIVKCEAGGEARLSVASPYRRRRGQWGGWPHLSSQAWPVGRLASPYHRRHGRWRGWPHLIIGGVAGVEAGLTLSSEAWPEGRLASRYLVRVSLGWSRPSLSLSIAPRRSVKLSSVRHARRGMRAHSADITHS